ncbi:MAG TPA: diacylglycerol kinase family protein [Chryseosolibacter sp.]|nr:diacylglycerol kinase family protein [Chryseosolibacter sp.]
MKSFRRFLKGFTYAGQGIKTSIREQRNLKVQSGVALIVVAAGFYFRITIIEWCLILFAIALVMGLEMMNSAVESLVDLVSPDYKPLAGRVKDMAAGAVLFAAILAAAIGALIFGQYLL